MLVLTRKLQEQIQIGDNITISILRVKGNSVRIGVQAPRDVRVVRSELPTFEQPSHGIDSPPVVEPKAPADVHRQTADRSSPRKPSARGYEATQREAPAGSDGGSGHSPRTPALRRFRLEKEAIVSTSRGVSCVN